MPPNAPDLREQLRRDIRERDVLVPVIVAQDGEVVNGRPHMEIAGKFGLKFVPKIVVDKLTEAERRDLRLFINVCRRQLKQA